MSRLAALAAFAIAFANPAAASISVRVAINYDNTVNTQYRLGDKPQGGSAPAGYTVAAWGDATECDIQDSAGTWTVTVANPGNEETGRLLGL